MEIKNIKIAVVGLGYVGLPVTVAFGKKYAGTIGFDINEKRVQELKSGIESNGDLNPEDLQKAKINFTTNSKELSNANFIIVAVPTPVDINNCPDFTALIAASKLVGVNLKKNATVVYESTVYPGATEEICLPVLEQYSGLKSGQDFFLGYSPERINPGDTEHTFENITKVVAGDSVESASLIAAVYGSVLKANVHKASSIKVAEAAKVIENTQRDLNIALMNELAIIFDKLNIDTQEVLKAAGTKWNFLKFTPGLVGGHCIGVDPFYLTTKAKQVGYDPQVVLAGRRINDHMAVYVAQKLIKLMLQAEIKIKGAKIGILGVTFKPDIKDTRNSKVFDLIAELKCFGVECLIHDPHADVDEIHQEYNLKSKQLSEFDDIEALILATPHKEYLGDFFTNFLKEHKKIKVVIDIYKKLSSNNLKNDIIYWGL